MKSKPFPSLKKRSLPSLPPESEPPVVVRIGVIGCGYWGPNLIRNFHELPFSKVVAVCDLDETRLKPLSKRYPGVQLTPHYQDLIKDPAIDAIIVATPTSTHYEIASRALKAGKHVLVEKPFTATSEEGSALIRLARRKDKILMVGHTFEYNPAVLKVTELLKTEELGKIYYIDSVRVNLGIYQSDGRNVIWDLAPHDLSMILQWVGEFPCRVSAWGQSFIQKGIEDVAFVRLEFPSGIIAHLHLSWLAPAKVRRITVVCRKKMVTFDDLESVEKIKVADQTVHLDPRNPEVRISYRLGDIVSPRVDVTEPLARECRHFIDCILQNQNPRTDGEKGLQVVRILEACDRSIKKGGFGVSL